MKLKPLFFIFIIFNGFALLAQKNTITNEWLSNKFELFSKSHSSTLLFVATDKNIYTNNEDIWFSAYLISKGNDHLNLNTILSILLVSEDDRKIYLRNRFFIEDGLSKGNLNLPDTIRPGRYQIIAYTNLVDKNSLPATVYNQPITIKSLREIAFSSTLQFLDSPNNADHIKAQVTVEEKDGKKVGGAEVKFSIGKGIYATGKTNNEGNYDFRIPSTDSLDDELLTTINYQNEIQFLCTKLPQIKPHKIKIHFYPEGGNVVSGLWNIVSWEAKVENGSPISITGLLYKNGKVMDTVSTNSYGIGKLKIMAKFNDAYTLKVLANSYQQLDSDYELPKIIPEGVALHIDNAVVNDTLNFAISSSQNKQVKVIIHNYRDAYAIFNLDVLQQVRKVSIALNTMPKGIGVVTVLNLNDQPIAERLFFAHYDEKITTEIICNKHVYDTKEKVNLKLKFNDKTGKPIDGLVSISCVQDSRIDKNISKDINTYVYLEDDLGHLPIFAFSQSFNDKDYVENILLTKGWRRYTWQDLTQSSLNDTLVLFRIDKLSGNVTYFNRHVNKPITLGLLTDSAFNILTTEKDGKFDLNYKELLAGAGKQIYLLLTQKDKIGYKINLYDAFVQYDQTLADHLKFDAINSSHSIQKSEKQLLSDFEKQISLKEVVVISKKSNLLLGLRGINACGDFVCSANILNCRNHLTGFKPIKGGRYLKQIIVDGILTKLEPIIYQGCSLDNYSKPDLAIPSVYTAKEFYGADYNQPGAYPIQYVSTIYWNPDIVIQNGETQCNFMTSDIPGKFRIVVQGISKNDVIFAESSFNVKN